MHVNRSGCNELGLNSAQTTLTSLTNSTFDVAMCVLSVGGGQRPTTIVNTSLAGRLTSPFIKHHGLGRLILLPPRSSRRIIYAVQTRLNCCQEGWTLDGVRVAGTETWFVLPFRSSRRKKVQNVIQLSLVLWFSFAPMSVLRTLALATCFAAGSLAASVDEWQSRSIYQVCACSLIS